MSASAHRALKRAKYYLYPLLSSLPGPGRIRERFVSLRHSGSLNPMTTMDQFREYVTHARPREFIFYQDRSHLKRADVASVLDAVGIDLSQKSAMDFGPGYGDSLDVFHARGASRCCFVERDPFFFTYNRLKGFTEGTKADCIKDLKLMPAGPYDLIWAKASVSYLNFSEQQIDYLWKWLVRLRKHTGRGGKIIICPWWAEIDGERLVRDVMAHWFTLTLLRFGFEILPSIPGHNVEPHYPLTYLYSKETEWEH